MVIGSRKPRPLCVACGGSVWSKGHRTVVLVVFAAWRPFRLLLGAYVFGLAVRTNFTLQALGFEEIQHESCPPEINKLGRTITPPRS